MSFVSDTPKEPIDDQDLPGAQPAGRSVWSRLSGAFERHPRLTRWMLCGPATLLLTVLLMMGSAHWLPIGSAGVDNIVLPVILFPLIWAGVFIYALAEDNLLRGVAVMGGLTVGHVGLLAVVM